MTKRGFTLIELLVVITIIGILMGLLLVSFQGTRRTARDGKRKTDLEQIRNALEMCRSDTGSYPENLSGCSYLPTVPTDPLSPTYSYPYTRTSETAYALCAYLEGGSVAVPGCGGNCGTVACNYKVTNP